MSTVYAAVDERLEREVAVKVMSGALSADPAFSDRFAREARAAARLSHVNVVSVYDQGVDSGPGGHHVFLVMELVEGRTLRDLIREKGRLSPAEAISIMEPVLSALSAAHRAGIVHRDVKPENILLSDDGVVKVADFGLARAVESDAAATRTGLMMGTVAYCAPEQIAAGPVRPALGRLLRRRRALRTAHRPPALRGRVGDDGRLPARAQPGPCAVVPGRRHPDADRRTRRQRDRLRTRRAAARRRACSWRWSPTSAHRPRPADRAGAGASAHGPPARTACRAPGPRRAGRRCCRAADRDDHRRARPSGRRALRHVGRPGRAPVRARSCRPVAAGHRQSASRDADGGAPDRPADPAAARRRGRLRRLVARRRPLLAGAQRLWGVACRGATQDLRTAGYKRRHGHHDTIQRDGRQGPGARRQTRPPDRDWSAGTTSNW